MSPIPQTTTVRTTPPAPGARPAAPGSQAAAAGPAPLAADTMELLARSVDRDGNRWVGGAEGAYQGPEAGGATWRGLLNALESGSGFLSGFRLAADAALAVADRFARGDAWVSKADLDFSDAARALVDVNGDNRVARHELATALQEGRIGVNARRVVTAEEARGAVPNHRPMPPAPRYHPESGDLGLAADRFERQIRGVDQIYNATNMTRDARDAEANRIGREALQALLAARNAPLASRQALLNRIYNATTFLTSGQRDALEQQLASDALALNRF